MRSTVTGNVIKSVACAVTNSPLELFAVTSFVESMFFFFFPTLSQLRVVKDNFRIDQLVNVPFNMISMAEFYILITDDFDKVRYCLLLKSLNYTFLSFHSHSSS